MPASIRRRSRLFKEDATRGSASWLTMRKQCRAALGESLTRVVKSRLSGLLRTLFTARGERRLNQNAQC